jgi:hypothetical protein
MKQRQQSLLRVLTAPMEFFGLSVFSETSESQSHLEGTTFGLVKCFFAFLAVFAVLRCSNEFLPRLKPLLSRFSVG